MSKVIFILIEGLAFIEAKECMGFLAGICERHLGAIYQYKCELPPVPKPLSECLLTGASPLDSGIVNMDVQRRSSQISVFDIAKKAGKSTAAAANQWISELYNGMPFDATKDRLTNNKNLAIQHGLFYWDPNYPDDHVYSDAHMLKTYFQPDFIFIHSMNIDSAGRTYGYNSSNYRNAVRKLDSILSNYLLLWTKDDYEIVITSDHGMSNDNNGGTLSEEQNVPLFTIGKKFLFNSHLSFSQTEICGSLCEILEISDHGKKSINGLLVK